MSSASTRRAGLGLAGALARPAGDVVGRTLSVAVVGWKTPLAAPVRRPAQALLGAAERRGAAEEARVVEAASDWFARVLDRVLHTLFAAQLLERLAVEALEGDSLERVLAITTERRAGIRVADAVLAGDAVERLVAHVAEQPALDQLVARALASPAFEQRLAAALEEPALERVLERVLASRFAHNATEQLLASEELRRVVGHVAASEQVREALHSQTAGLVDDVGDELRDRTVSVDDRMEGVARRLFRRHARVAPFASFDEGPAHA